MKAILCYLIVLTAFLLPGTAFAQRGSDAAYIEGRLSGLQQQLVDLSARLEQLKIQDQQLQQRLEEMRTKFEARLGRLESVGAGSGRR
jgi:TolA-binding protein